MAPLFRWFESADKFNMWAASLEPLRVSAEDYIGRRGSLIRARMCRLLMQMRSVHQSGFSAHLSANAYLRQRSSHRSRTVKDAVLR